MTPSRAGDYRVHTRALPEALALVHELLDRVRADHPDVARVALDDLDHQRVDGHNAWRWCVAGADVRPPGEGLPVQPPGILLR